LLSRYIHFFLHSKDEHGVHSPFVFNLYTSVIKPADPYYIFAEIEACRSALLTSKEEIVTEDMGAGSKVHNSAKRKIKDIARYSLKDTKTAQLLFRLVNYFNPRQIVDLGTSLGITTLYLAAPNPNSTVYTFEGCKETLAVARRNFNQFGYTHIRPVAGNIDHSLPECIKKVSSLDFVFFDANHRLAPTLRYFTLCLTKAHTHSVFVFDDIYWSAEMAEAWRQIKAHPQVTLTIDLFRVGLVFFRKEQPKQHFKLRF
jgi:predicted O-methyltransferase YrrM